MHDSKQKILFFLLQSTTRKSIEISSTIFSQLSMQRQVMNV